MKQVDAARNDGDAEATGDQQDASYQIRAFLPMNWVEPRAVAGFDDRFVKAGIERPRYHNERLLGERREPHLRETKNRMSPRQHNQHVLFEEQIERKTTVVADGRADDGEVDLAPMQLCNQQRGVALLWRQQDLRI